jgi:hypothetical protein
MQAFKLALKTARAQALIRLVALGVLLALLVAIALATGQPVS